MSLFTCLTTLLIAYPLALHIVWQVYANLLYQIAIVFGP
jgi:hypothetical protein